jgi:STE24 endopeptidase
MPSQLILATYLSLLAVQYLLEQILLLLNLRQAWACSRRPPPEALEIMPEAEYRRALEYSRARGWLGLISNTVGTALILALILSGALGRLEALIGAISVAELWRAILLVYAVSLLFGLVSLPGSIYAQFVIEARFGFNRTTPRLFLLDLMKGLALSLAVATPLLILLFLLVRATPLWWLWAFVGLSAFQLLMVLLYPRLIAPLFNRFTPLPEGPLKDKIEELARRLRFRTRGIYLMDASRRSEHGNAYFTGLGRSKRIVLFDTLIRSLTPEQAAAVLAHEVGHERKRHTIWRLVLSLLASLAGFWLLHWGLSWNPLFQAFGFTAASLPAAVVLLLYFSEPLAMLLKPLASWGSRRQEHAADRFAFREAGCGEAFVEALIGLSRRNLSNPTPHPWASFYFATHPTVVERIRALRVAHAGADCANSAC